jgi:large subunit ribosomal protein L6
MSRVGKSPVPIPAKTEVSISGQSVAVKGPLGSLNWVIPGNIAAEVKDKEVLVTRPNDQKEVRAMHGLTRALINNMVIGCSTGFVRELQLIGVGYRAELNGKALVLYVGYSHPIVFHAPEGIGLEVIPKENKIIIKGIDKELVGLIAAKIRSFRKPEPYKGKGIRYTDEYVRTKAGKTAGA